MLLFQDSLDKQITHNQHKNLFNDTVQTGLHFLPETLLAIARIDEIDTVSESMLIDYATQKTMQSFCNSNQYYNFDTQAQIDLRSIYLSLFYNLHLKAQSVDAISKIHFRELTEWLRSTNTFAETMYKCDEECIKTVVCSEYSAALQIKILQIDLNHILEPVLDIGCGKEGHLVNYLRKQGIEAYGFDRFAYESSILTNNNWLEFPYQSQKWGTICSNLGFSNHFHHHNLRKDGDFVLYAQKYMEILNSLKMSGSFHYAPSLPFIEQFLDSSKFKHSSFVISQINVMASNITRLL